MNIVHVEDDLPLKDILKTTLLAFEPGLKITQFTSGDEALSYIREKGEEIDLFILDIRLPGKLNGIQLAEEIRSLHCSGNLVLTSAFMRPQQEVLNSLDCEYYRKPWHLMDLTQRLLRYMPGKKDTAVSPAVSPAMSPTVSPTGSPTGSPAISPAVPQKPEVSSQ